jgi:hypothetical protein
MKINQTKSITEIQREFSDIFPFLKIEFFKKSHNTFGGNSNKEIISKTDSIKIKEIGEIFITESMTVNELEQRFKTQFGLNIQIFRKHGKTWIETTVTDNWSLTNKMNKVKF